MNFSQRREIENKFQMWRQSAERSYFIKDTQANFIVWLMTTKDGIECIQHLKEEDMETEIKLGKEAKDKITGFKGILTAKCEYLYGCTQYGLVPKISKDGKRENIEWFDEGRIEVIGRGILPEEVKAEKDGAEINLDCPRGRG